MWDNARTRQESRKTLGVGVGCGQYPSPGKNPRSEFLKPLQLCPKMAKACKKISHGEQARGNPISKKNPTWEEIDR